MDFDEHEALLSPPLVGMTVEIHPNTLSDRIRATSVPVQGKKILRLRFLYVTDEVDEITYQFTIW